MTPRGFTFHADTYCPACAERLPERDPEGAPKGAFYGFEEADAPCACGACGAFLPVALTAYGLRYVADAIREATDRAFPMPLPPALAAWAAEYGAAREVAAAVAEREVALELPTLICRGFTYRLTDRQRLALARVILRHKVPEADVLRAAYPEMGNPDTACLMVPLPSGLTLGIERDGYAHS
jgi:hypothetical protein